MDKEQNNLIVIAEDSPTQAEKLKFLLNGFGYEVAHGINGKEAFDLAKKYLPIVIITDILMPEMDGYELCRKIKADEKLKQIPVVLLTVLTNATDILKGLSCGADNYIMKPYDEKYLSTNLNSILANKHILKEDQVKTKINQENVNAAQNKLNAFCNLVAAQSGKHIDADAADALLASAQAVSNSL